MKKLISLIRYHVFILVLEFSVGARLQLIRDLKKYIWNESLVRQIGFCSALQHVLSDTLDWRNITHNEYLCRQRKVLDILLLSHFKPSIADRFYYPIEHVDLRLMVLAFLEDYYVRLQQINMTTTLYPSPLQYIPLPKDVDKWCCEASGNYNLYYRQYHTYTHTY